MPTYGTKQGQGGVTEDSVELCAQLFVCLRPLLDEAKPLDSVVVWGLCQSGRTWSKRPRDSGRLDLESSIYFSEVMEST
jgi:hypothetical protein